MESASFLSYKKVLGGMEEGDEEAGSEDWNKSAGDGRHGSPLADYITRFTIE